MESTPILAQGRVAELRKPDWLSLSLARVALRWTRMSLVAGLAGSRRWLAVHRGAVSFTATAPDGARLAAIRLPAQPRRHPRLPLVMAHGYCEPKENHLPRAALLAAAGHDVILFDMRGHGRSGGDCITFGVRERHDVQAILDHAQHQGLIPPGAVLTVGYSLGAATMLQHAAIDPRVAGVVALAPFVDMVRAVRSYRALYAPWTNEAAILGGFHAACHEAGFEIGEASPLAAMSRLQVPVLIAVGRRDRNLSPAEHSRILAGAHPAGRCRLIEVPRADHVSIARRLWPHLDRAIVRFCARLSRRAAAARR